MAAADPPLDTATAAAPGESAASTRAAQTGKPVEVVSETTETTQVMANPDGTFTSTTARHPVRVRRDDVWVPVDTALDPNPDGSYSPAATAEMIRFSGGGSGPLVTLGAPGSSVSVFWPAALPAPAVSGNTAVYPAVLPGVDLRVSADADSYSEVLVIYDATAAANPALAHVKLTDVGDGLNLNVSSDGLLSAVDASGAEVFHGSQPIIWDSASSGAVGPKPSAEDPGSGRISLVDVTATTGGTPAGGAGSGASATSTTELTLTPDPGALTGPAVTYPVYFDPSMTGAKQHYATVMSGGWHYYDAADTARVGFCGWPGCNGIGTGRSYFQINTATITGRATTATIYAADFVITQIHTGPHCVAEPTDLYQANAFNSGTVWGGPITALLQQVSAAHSDNCATDGPNAVHYNNANVVAYVQEAATDDHASLNFALRAPSESDLNQWKQFDNNPQLIIKYNFPPSVPTGLKVSNAVSCGGRVYTADAFPSLYAVGVDNNPSPLQLDLWFELWPTGGSARAAWNTTGVRINSGTQGSWPTNRPGGLGNADWSFRARAENLPSDVAHLWSGWSGWYQFSSRANPITAAPTLDSLDYPEGYWGLPQGVAGKFTLTPRGAADIAGYTYSWAGSGTEPALTATTCNYTRTIGDGGLTANSATTGTGSITVPATLTAGYHILHARSFDHAHNLSPETGYAFYIAPNQGPPVTATHLEAENTTQVTLGQPAGQNLAITQQTGPAWSNNAQMLLPGTATGQSLTMTFTAPIEADYALGLNLGTGSDYGALSFTLDGAVLVNSDTTPFDGYTATTWRTYEPLGGAHLTGGPHTLAITVVGTNAASTGNRYYAGVDYLTAAPINNVVATSFSAAMNNHGIAQDDTATTANLDNAYGENLSAQSLTAAGYAPGTTTTIDGARFTIPAANAAGNDNVIATGQTIPLPAAQQLKATAIGLLAVSTCGASPTVKGAVTYTDGTHGSPRVPAVPDWIVGSPTAASVVLSHWDLGSSPDNTRQPKMYAIFLPTDPTKTPASVTLPNIGSNFLPGSCPTALHILAAAPRPAAAGWIGTWTATAETATTPPGGADLANQTLRLVLHPTVTGINARIRLSNTYAATPVTIDHATLAAQAGTAAATLSAPTQLTFCTATGQTTGCGTHAVTLPAGAEAYSDPIACPDTAGGSGNLTVSIHLPTAVTAAPTHTGSNTTNYLAAGDTTANTDGTPYTTTLTSSHYLTAVDASTSDTSQGTVAVLGDQTSATGAPGNTYQPTWIDDLPAKLGTDLPGGLVNASLAGTQTTTWWRTTETGTNLNHTILNEPNLRTVIITLGAQDLLQNTSPATIETNLTQLLKPSASAYAIGNNYRTDGSLIHLVLATIPPLGLAANDQRETNRRQLNTDILVHYTDYGADDVVDYDQAVRDNTNPNNINPAYLTTGSPNNAYYDTIAQTLTDAVQTFPPSAQL